MNPTPQYVGFWVTIFVNRSAIERARQFFSQQLGFHLIEGTTSELGRGKVWVDARVRSWITDTATFQYLSDLPCDQAEAGLAHELQSFLMNERDSLIGATGLEIWTMIDDESIPELQGTVFATTIGPVELSLKTLATHETKLSFGRATLRIPKQLNSIEQKQFRQQNASQYLMGLEGVLVIPQLLGHKVGWLTLQTETVPIQNNLNHLPKSILAELESITSRFQENSPKTSHLNEVMTRIVQLTETESLLAVNAHELRIQQEHLRHHVDRGVAKELHSLYFSFCQTSLGNLTRNIEQITRLNGSLSNASAVARLSLEERREVSIRHAEGLLAAIGLGIAVLALFESDFVIHANNWIFGFSLTKDSPWGSFLVFLVRISLVIISSIATWYLIVKPYPVNTNSIHNATGKKS